MREAGYTLVEMMVALVIVGGTAAAFSEGVAAMNRIQADAGASLGQGRGQARVQQALSHFLEARGPFGTVPGGQVLTGEATVLDFKCGPSTCHAGLEADGDARFLRLEDESGEPLRIALPRGGESRFHYSDGETWLSAWPPKDDNRLLRSVSIVSRAGPAAVAQLALQQRADCEFDPIVKSCRRGANDGP